MSSLTKFLLWSVLLTSIDIIHTCLGESFQILFNLHLQLRTNDACKKAHRIGKQRLESTRRNLLTEHLLKTNLHKTNENSSPNINCSHCKQLWWSRFVFFYTLENTFKNLVYIGTMFFVNIYLIIVINVCPIGFELVCIFCLPIFTWRTKTRTCKGRLRMRNPILSCVIGYCVWIPMLVSVLKRHFRCVGVIRA